MTLGRRHLQGCCVYNNHFPPKGENVRVLGEKISPRERKRVCGKKEGKRKRGKDKKEWKGNWKKDRIEKAENRKKGGKEKEGEREGGNVGENN